MHGQTNVLSKGCIIAIKYYKIKMNFGTPTIVLKRPFQLEGNTPTKGQKVSKTNNIDPNVFDSATHNEDPAPSAPQR